MPRAPVTAVLVLGVCACSKNHNFRTRHLTAAFQRVCCCRFSQPTSERLQARRARKWQSRLLQWAASSRVGVKWLINIRFSKVGLIMKCPECSIDNVEGVRFCGSCGAQLQRSERFVLGVDLDGVVADFYGALRPIAAEWRGVSVDDLTSEVSYGLKEWAITPQEYQELHRFAVVQKQIFSTQPAIPGAAAALRRLGYNPDIRIRIITHRLFIKYTHEISVRQTIEWLEEYCVPYWDICFMKEKGDVGADLYIEDSPSNIAALRKAGKDVLIFTNSTNILVEGLRANDWKEVEQKVIEKLGDWQAIKAEKSNK